MLRYFFSRPQPQPVEELPPAKVAIIGAGIGGSFAAKFLRENGGENLDIRVFAKKGSEIGGRTAVCQIGDHIYETGASVIHSSNQHLVDLAKDHELATKTEEVDVPVGFYNGVSMFSIGINKIINFFRMFWRYGFDIFRMNSSVGALLTKFKAIYTQQSDSSAYATTEDLLGAMGGESVSGLMKVSAGDYMRNEQHWNELLIDELITAALRVNYGQDTSVNAFTAYVALAGMQSGSLWSVVGGNYKLAECALMDGGCSSPIMDDVVSVSKIQVDDIVRYTVTTEDGNIDEGYNVVIVANPLNLSKIKYENFSNDVYSPAASTPYQRIVATFIKGKINQEFFGEEADSLNFPQVILTTDMESPPFDFNSVAVEIPSDIEQDDVKEYTTPIQDDPIKVWKVFSPEPLTQDQCQALFSEFDPNMPCFDWMAYPHYDPPDMAPSFILDDGVFYINAIEKAASAMEMSAIGAKNAALLARNYLLQKTS